jgi:hypothetical protein
MSIARRASLVPSTLCCVALTASTALAREPRGGAAHSGSSHREVTRTGPDGRSRTWVGDTSWQRGNGRFDRHTVQTGPRGATRSKDVHVERTDTGATRTTRVTRPDGSSVESHQTFTRSGPAQDPAAAD